MHTSDDSPISKDLADEDATLKLGARLAHLLKPGMVIYLHGDLGAGKTTLVRGVLRALGYSGNIKSPTYTLVEPYHVGGLDLLHFDLYRLNSASEWESAAFHEEVDGKKILFIEWPERATGMTPSADLEVAFDILKKGRRVSIGGFTPTGRECLRQL